MNKAFLIFLFTMVMFPVACSHKPEALNENAITINIQPFTGFPKYLTQQVAEQLKSINPNIIINPEIDIPPSSFYTPKMRYRADTIINILSRNTLPKHVTIGLTKYDISTTKGKIEDWGIMGLGLRPGNACVVSTFRLKAGTRDSQFYKVCIHELGHTAGLNHCNEKTCFMRDADGGNPIDEEISFCNKCKNFLLKKGWKL